MTTTPRPTQEQMEDALEVIYWRILREGQVIRDANGNLTATDPTAAMLGRIQDYLEKRRDSQRDTTNPTGAALDRLRAAGIKIDQPLPPVSDGDDDATR